MHKIKTEKELEAYLKALVNTTLSNAGKSLNEDTSRDNFNSKLNAEMKKLIGEQGEEEEEEPGEEEGESGEGEAESEEEDESEETTNTSSDKPKNPAAEKTKEYEDYTDDFMASFDDIKDAINILRAGRSLKDEAISQELNDYYDILDEDEKGVLLIYLRELSKIITGAIEGEEAQDPSNPKTYYKIDKIKNEEGKDVKDTTLQSDEKPQKPAAEPQAAPQKPLGAEDTSPPIRVNESQDFSRLKKLR